MQHVHLAILALPGHEALAQRMQVAHIYGDANPTADAASRGYFDALHEMLTILGAKPERVPHPAELDTLLEELVGDKKTPRRAPERTRAQRAFTAIVWSAYHICVKAVPQHF